MDYSRKKGCFEVIPENVEFEQQPLRSLGDETPSDDTADDRDNSEHTEQEENSRKRKAKSKSQRIDTETQQSN